MRAVLCVAAVVAAIGWARWDAQASCAGRTKCQVAKVTVRSCAAIDPANEAGVMRYVAELRKEKRRAEAQRFLDSYRGVLVEVHEESREQLECARGLPKARYDEAAYRIGGGSLEPTPEDRAGISKYYLPTRDAKACEARFPTGRVLRMSEQQPCCDGDPGVPCLISR